MQFHAFETAKQRLIAECQNKLLLLDDVVGMGGTFHLEPAGT